LRSDRFARVLAAVNREIPDKVPWWLWTHFPALPWLRYYSWEKSTRDGEELARAHLAFLQQLDYKMDLLKVTSWHFGSFQWGTKWRFTNNDEYPQKVEVPVKQTEDWRKLWVLDPKKELREWLRTISILSREIGRTMPFMFTIHSPMMQALHQVSTPERVYADMKSHPDALKEGLETITQTCIDFSKACINEGAPGIFYGIGGGGQTWSRMDRRQLEEFQLHYDKKVLEAVRDLPVKMLHICGKTGEDPQTNGGLMESGWFKQYAVDAINWWDTRYTSASTAKKIYGDKFCVCAGLDQDITKTGTPEQVENQVKKAIDSTAKGGGFMIASGCTVLTPAPLENINAVGRAVEKYGRYSR